MKHLARNTPCPRHPLRWFPCLLAVGCGLTISSLAQESNLSPEPDVPDPLDSPVIPDPADAGPAPTVPIEDALVGAWKFAKRSLDPGAAAITSVNRYSEDGIYVCSIHMEFPEREQTIHIAGNWILEGDDVKITLTESDAPGIYKVGLTFVLHNVRIDGDRLVYNDASGVEQIRTRIIEEETPSEESPAPTEEPATPSGEGAETESAEANDPESRL